MELAISDGSATSRGSLDWHRVIPDYIVDRHYFGTASTLVPAASCGDRRGSSRLLISTTIPCTRQLAAAKAVHRQSVGDSARPYLGRGNSGTVASGEE